MAEGDTTLTSLQPTADVGGVSVSALITVLEDVGVRIDRQAPARLLARFSQYADYELTSDDGRLRLRMPIRFGTGVAEEFEREQRVLGALHDSVAAMPRVVAFHDGSATDGVPFSVLADTDGDDFLSHPGLAKPAACAELVDALAGAFAQLHGAPVEPMVEARLVPRNGFVRQVLQGWRKRAGLVTENTPPGALMELVDWVEDYGAPEPDVLVPINNQVSLRRVKVLPPAERKKLKRMGTLLDWSAATAGDPLLDLGLALVGWPDKGDPVELRSLDYVLDDVPAMSREAMATAYASRLGIKLDELPFYRVIGLMRAAVFELRRFSRVRRGIEPGIEGLDHAEVSEYLLDLAMDVTMERAF